jgi:hypothetical protein
VNWSWLPWKSHNITNGHEAREAKADAQQKLRDAEALRGRVDSAAQSLRKINAENHIRTRMEQAFRGHQ